jgi:hypothetical protein
LQRTAGNRAVLSLLASTGRAKAGSDEEDHVSAGRRYPEQGTEKTAVEPVSTANSGAPPRLIAKATKILPIQSKGQNPGATDAVTGLGFTTTQGPTSGHWGNFSWAIWWELDKPSPAGGWVVQHVQTKFDVKDSGKKVVDPKTAGVDPDSWPLWEAWKVNPGQKISTYNQNKEDPPFDDQYAMPGFGTDTTGQLEIKGTAEFYEGLHLPGAFKADPSSPAGDLPSTKSSPGALKGGTGSVAHNASAKWDPGTESGTTKLTHS